MSVKHTFTSKDGLTTKTITKTQAIRAHCLDCAAQQPGEVKNCHIVHCPLFPFRFGNEKGLSKVYEPTEPAKIEITRTPIKAKNRIMRIKRSKTPRKIIRKR